MARKKEAVSKGASFVVETTKLQEMLSKAVRGAGMNRTLPLTSLVEMFFDGKVLSFLTTDFQTYLKVFDKVGSGEKFRAVLPIDILYRLVASTTAEAMEFSIVSGVVNVKGNGNYKIPIEYDVDGAELEYPNPIEDNKGAFKGGEDVTLKSSDVAIILSNVKPAIGMSEDNPCYMNYYVGGEILATDSFVISSYNKKVLKNAVLINQQTANLLDAISDEEIVFKTADGMVEFEGSGITIYSSVGEGIEDFAIKPISKLVKTSYGSVCEVSRNELLGVLDRLSLFVGAYDKEVIRIIFGKKSMQIESVQANGIEEVEYTSSSNAKAFECKININTFKQMLKGQSANTTKISYGESNAIKMEFDKVTQIVALFVDGE